MKINKTNNPYAEFVTVCTKIHNMTITDIAKHSEYKNLYNKYMRNMLKETDALINNQTAFGKNCLHWNQIDPEPATNKQVTNLKNPWLLFKREFEKAIKLPSSVDACLEISKSLGWHSNTKHLKAWLA